MGYVPAVVVKQVDVAKYTSIFKYDGGMSEVCLRESAIHAWVSVHMCSWRAARDVHESERSVLVPGRPENNT